MNASRPSLRSVRLCSLVLLSLGFAARLPGDTTSTTTKVEPPPTAKTNNILAQPLDFHMVGQVYEYSPWRDIWRYDVFPIVYPRKVQVWSDLTIIFTPSAPALAQPLQHQAPPSPIFDRLLPYMQESFFAPLSHFLVKNNLSKARNDQLEAYRHAKLTLLAELHQCLETNASLPAAEREARFTALAQSQTTALAALESQAEELRADLVKGSFWDERVDWNDTRLWRLGEPTGQDPRLDEFQVFRGAASFQPGLSLEQRQLLLELATDCLEAIVDSKAADAGQPGKAASAYFHFSPFTARLHLPADLPASVQADIAAYQSLKNEIKKSLRDTIVNADGKVLSSTRERIVRELARQQAADFERLDVIAERIRQGLQGHHLPDEPWAGSLPPALQPRLADYLRAKQDLQQGLNAKLASLRSQLPSDRVDIARIDGGYGIVVQPQPEVSEDYAEQRRHALADIPDFNREQVRRLAEVTLAKDRLREAIRMQEGQTPALAKMNGSTTPSGSAGWSASAPADRTLDQLLGDYAKSFSQQELWSRYKDYRQAVLEPGLSPAQRRLLLASALEELALPDKR